MNCYPWWHNFFQRWRSVRYPGGASVPTDIENVPSLQREQGLEAFVLVDPAVLRANADRQLMAMGLPPTKSQDEYSLARNITTETGTGSAEQKMAMGLSTVNEARRRGMTVHGLIVLNNRLPNRYGRIHPHGSTSAAPFGRFTASSKEPSVEDIVIARFILDGHAGRFPDDFAKGANDQAQVRTESWVRALWSRRQYWVGEIPGVDASDVALFITRKDIAPQSPEGLALLDFALKHLVGRPKGEFVPPGRCVQTMPVAQTIRGGFSLAEKLGMAALAFTAVGSAIASIFVAMAPATPRTARSRS